MINQLLFRSFLLFFCFAIPASSFCYLCESGVDGINWPHHKVDSSGTTCVLKAIDMAKIDDANSASCQAEISMFRGPCCGNSMPDAVQQIPTKPPTYNGPVGPHAPCDLCKTGDYPSETSMVINMLYIGVGSCAQFYDYGKQKLIPEYLCDALQFFAYEPCGCGEFNRNTNGGVYQQAAQAPPGNTPQSSPSSPPPTQRPTARPTIAPSPPPTQLPTARPSPNNNSFNGNDTTDTDAYRKTPDSNEKDNLKLGNQENRGGNGGMRRYLKGSR